MMMRRRKLNSFELDSRGKCFLCMGDISPSANPAPSVKKDGNGQLLKSVTSLECISGYLKLNMKVVLDQERPISQQLLAKLVSSHLKVELCTECSSLNDKFSEHFKQLERIRMEMGRMVEMFQAKLINSSDTSQMTNDKGRGSGRRGVDKPEIFRRLRAEAKEKCARKLANLHPRVKVRKLLTQRKMNQAQKGQKPNNQQHNTDCSTPEVEIGDVKLVRPTPGLLLDDDDDEDTNSSDGDYADSGSEGDKREVKKKASKNGVKRGTGSGGDGKIKPTHTLKCIECAKEFCDVSNFRRHYKSVHQRFKVKCDFCHKTFSDRSHMRRHQRLNNCGGTTKDNVASPRRNLRQCHICFHKVRNLSAHLYTVHFGRKIKKRKGKGMDKNGMGAEDALIIIEPASKVKQKFKVDPHTGRVKCGICQNSFASKSGFGSHHLSVHSKMKYKCRLCKAEFSYQRTFTDHYKNVHVGDRIQCHKCGRIFTLQTNLSIHLRMTSCGMGRRDGGGDDGKMEEAASKQNGNCHFCGKGFDTSQKLHEHLKTLHVGQAPAMENKADLEPSHSSQED